MASTATLEIPNFPRDKQTAKLDLASIQFGVGRGISTPTGNSNHREAAVPNISEIVVTREMDDNSAILFQESLIGKPRPMNIYLLNKTGNTIKTYLSVYMENCMISGYSHSSGGDRPTESLSINFTKITYKYEAPSEK